MHHSSKTFGLLLSLLLAVCLFGHIAQAKYAGSGMAASAQTSTYVFVPDQSKLVQTGGIAGVHWTYSIKGQFQVTVDPNAGSALFAHVDANATDDSPFKRTLDLNHVFNMTSLAGTLEPSGSIKFTGKAADDSDILITVTLAEGLAHLIGQTTPPPNSADFFIFSLDAVAQRKYGGGSGTADDPYQIATAADLIALGEDPNDYDKHFIMTEDIDLAGITYSEAVIPNFAGMFDGNGHTISHLTIAGVSNVGLFGYLASSAEVKDLGVVDVNITGSGYDVGGLVALNCGAVTQCYSTGSVSGMSYVGGLVGWNDYAGTVSRCYSAGPVSGTGEYSSVGGLVGGNGGTIRNCSSASPVSGTSYVGGLVGRSDYMQEGGDIAHGSIDSCYSSGSISGTSHVGGLVGGNSFGTIANSYSTGSVSGTDGVGGLAGFNSASVISHCYSASPVSGTSSVGGLVGQNFRYGSISNCYSTGTVSGTEYVGGLVGQNGLSWHPVGSINACYAKGNVIGELGVGGLVGYTSGGTVTQTYSTGEVTGTSYVGGLVGFKEWSPVVTASFWDMETSGQATSDGAAGTGKTTAEMQTAGTFLEAGWDFVNVWGIGENQTYPYLRKYSAADINQDASVNFLDLAVLAENWLTDISHR